jgi:AraC-like DNA-binding protein
MDASARATDKAGHRPGKALGSAAGQRDASRQSEWAHFVALPELGLQALHAHYVRHEYERHTHDFFVIGVVDSGAPNFGLSNRRFTAPAGTAMIINPGEPHDGRASDGNGYTYSMVYVDDAAVRSLVEELQDVSLSVEFELPVVSDPEVVAGIFRLHRAVMQGRSRLDCEVELLDALKPLVARFSTSRSRDFKTEHRDARISRVRDCILANFAQSLSTTDLALASGLGRARLSDLFRAEYGLPPHSYLNAVRMSAAKEYLKKGIPPAEVAAAVGLSDQSHLIRRFKGSFGITPNQFISGHHTNVR